MHTHGLCNAFFFIFFCEIFVSLFHCLVVSHFVLAQFNSKRGVYFFLILCFVQDSFGHFIASYANPLSFYCM